MEQSILLVYNVAGDSPDSKFYLIPVQDLTDFEKEALDSSQNKYINIDDDTEKLLSIAARVEVFTEEDTLVQWTGIYDSLGKEIWEGDILDSIVNEGYFKVVWRADLAKFVARMDGIYDAVLNEFNWKVKGNIFEHPELLE